MVHGNAVTLKQLRALAAITRAGSLTAAANVLNVTTPAVSTQLRALESNFGTQLLHRGPAGRLELTAAGKTVLAAVTEIENALQHCFRHVEALRAGKEGHVILGVVSTGKYFAPGLVVRVRDALPNIDLELDIGNRSDIIAALRNHRVDLAVMGRPPRDPVVEAERLGDHPHLMIAPPGHTLVGKSDVTAQRLLEETFLCREHGSGTRILMERFLDRIGEGTPYKMIELGTNETIKQAVIAGLGIALISAHTVEAELASGRLKTIDMEGLPIIRQWFIVHPKGRPLTAAAAHVRQFLIGLQGEFLPSLPAPA